jgi:rhodanese-related sulfurtransferase
MSSNDNSSRKPVALSPCEAFDFMQSGAAIIDIRPEYETNYRMIDSDSVYLISYDSYKERFADIPKDTPLIIVDNVGLKSPEVAGFLLEQGFGRVAYVVGGILDWEHSGLPLLKDFDYELRGSCACMLRVKK